MVQSRGFEWFARAGFVARGLIYGIIGVLSVKLAIGHGGKTTNQQGALHTIVHQPLGKTLLVIVAIGLGGYAFWRIVRALLGHGPEARDSAVERVAGFASGVVYSGLCVLAIGIIAGAGGSGTGAKKTTAGVFGWPGGQWLVGIAGLVLIGVGFYQGYLGVSEKFLEQQKTAEMSPATKRWVSFIGVFGLLARMVVFALIGVFLIKAAVDYSASQAVGLDGALASLIDRSYGPYLLGIVAAGLVAFALYSLSDARYRKV
ncbi:MAG: DUF1206 domain-containing protein [Actinobacteria bacterium]|nr:DUF1206 domain-containing protein [Actinomycetota bacterium]